MLSKSSVGQAGTDFSSPPNALTKSFDDLVEFVVFPSHENRRLLITFLAKLALQAADLVEGEAGIDGQPGADGGRLDGHQRAHVGKGAAVVGFTPGGQRREDEVGPAKFRGEHSGQREGAVEALAGELALVVGGFLAVADEHNGFDLGGFNLGLPCQPGRRAWAAGRQAFPGLRTEGINASAWERIVLPMRNI